MQSNKDYATENTNLQQQIKDLKEQLKISRKANKELLKENEKLKTIIKENFAYYPDALFEKVCFKWTGPVMEDEIKEVLGE